MNEISSSLSKQAMKRRKVEQEKARNLIVIPARMQSERLPGKPMRKVAGRPLIHWTYDRAKQTSADHVVVATSDREVADYCRRSGLIWMKTREDHPNGTSRCLEILRMIRSTVKIGRIVNWQCDEPMVPPGTVDLLLIPKVARIGTIVSRACPLPDDPNSVKVVWSFGRCHWFDRVPMTGCGTHVGVYGFSPTLLEAVCLIGGTTTGDRLKLEQIPWIERGYAIEPLEVEDVPLSIDTFDDLREFRWKVEKEGITC